MEASSGRESRHHKTVLGRAVRAEAQANAYQQIAEQSGNGGQNGETTALIGTMLDTMMQDAPKK